MPKNNAKPPSRIKKSTPARAVYSAPAGWLAFQKLALPLDAVTVSTANYEDGEQGAIIRKAFVALWNDYTKYLKGKRTNELCVAVHPDWLKAALASPELTGHQVQTNRGVMLYGLRVRVDDRLDVDEIVAEEKQ